MYVVECMDCQIDIRLPACAASITTATLDRACTPSVPLTVTSTPNPAGGFDVAITRPQPGPSTPTPALARGVWTLTLSNSCQCFTAPVWIGACPPPAFPATASLTPAPAPSHCVPSPQPDLTLPNPVLSILFALSGDRSSIGIDTSPTPPVLPYGVLEAPGPTPPLTRLAITAPFTDPSASPPSPPAPSTLSGTITPTGLPTGTLWALLDGDGFVVASGATALSGDTATFSASITPPVSLRCGPYTLTLTAPTP